MKKPSFVYLGIYDLGPGSLFIKAGKANHPEKRARAYNTHCPGGLTAMYAVETTSAENAYATEYRLLGALRSLECTHNAGGEWLQVDHSDLDAVFETFVRIAGEPSRIHIERRYRVANWGA